MIGWLKRLVYRFLEDEAANEKRYYEALVWFHRGEATRRR